MSHMKHIFTILFDNFQFDFNFNINKTYLKKKKKMRRKIYKSLEKYERVNYLYFSFLDKLFF